MKTKLQKSIKIPSNVGYHGKHIKDYDLRAGTWNEQGRRFRPAMEDALKCRTDITAI